MSRVTVTNPFDLLADEDSTNVPAPSKKEQKPPSAPAKQPAKPAAAATGAATAKPAAPKAEAVKAAPANTTTHNASQVVKAAPARDANQNLQEREKESRAPRDKRDGPRQPKIPDSGKRASDKASGHHVSGTGHIKGEQKKGGAGQGNWGADEAKEGAEYVKDEKADEKDEADEEKVTVVEGEKKEGEAAPKEGAAPAAAEPVKDEDKVTRTFEEYLAEKKKSTGVKVDALKPRTVNDDEFKGFVALSRGEEGTAPLNAKDKKEKKDKKPKETTAKPTEAEKKDRDLAAKLLTFSTHQDQKRAERGNFRGERNYEDRRGSGDRPQGAGRGRGGPKGTYNNSRPGGAPNSPGSSQPPVDQEKDFPSLSPHGSDPVKA